VPGSGLPIFQAATANFTRMAETTVITDGTDRCPLLLTSGAEDHTVPLAVVENEYRIQQKNSGDTEFVSIPGRGHSFIIDPGWREVACSGICRRGRARG
jgi:non-heme chloroperoxidase